MPQERHMQSLLTAFQALPSRGAEECHLMFVCYRWHATIVHKHQGTEIKIQHHCVDMSEALSVAIARFDELSDLGAIPAPNAIEHEPAPGAIAHIPSSDIPF